MLFFSLLAVTVLQSVTEFEKNSVNCSALEQQGFQVFVTELQSFSYKNMKIKKRFFVGEL